MNFYREWRSSNVLVSLPEEIAVQEAASIHRRYYLEAFSYRLLAADHSLRLFKSHKKGVLAIKRIGRFSQFSLLLSGLSRCLLQGRRFIRIRMPSQLSLKSRLHK